MSIVQEARNAVGCLLGEPYTQEYFAELLGVQVATIQAWEQGEVVPKGTTYSLWLQLLIWHTDFMVAALTAFKIESRLGIKIPFEIAAEIVDVLMKPNKSRVQLSRRACAVLARSACRAERL